MLSNEITSVLPLSRIKTKLYVQSYLFLHKDTHTALFRYPNLESQTVPSNIFVHLTPIAFANKQFFQFIDRFLINFALHDSKPSTRQRNVHTMAQALK